MKILAFLYAYPPDRLAGADLMSQVMLRALAARGHQVSVRTLGPGVERTNEGVHVLPNQRITSLRHVTPEVADLLYTHPDVGPTMYAIALGLGIPVVSVVHNTGPRMGQFLRGARSAPGLIVWNSKSTRAALAGPNSEDGIVCVPPLDVSAHQVQRDPEVAQRITLVNLSPDKGAELFWQLAERMPGRKFLGVVGAHGTQMTTHPRLGSLPNVDIVGPLHPTRMRDLVWASTRVVLAPSNLESWGMAACEAMCSGIPVVAHPTPGLLESLDGVGVFADRSRTEDWMRAINLAWVSDQQPYRARAEQIQALHREGLAQFVERVEALV